MPNFATFRMVYTAVKKNPKGEKVLKLMRGKFRGGRSCFLPSFRAASVCLFCVPPSAAAAAAATGSAKKEEEEE